MTSLGSNSVAVTKFQSSIAVSCAPSTLAVGSSTNCTGTVTGYSVSGETISFIQGAGGSGRTSIVRTGGACALSGNSCAITIGTTGAGAASIIATYPGDGNNAAPQSPGSTSLTITQAVTSTTVVCSPATLFVGTPTTCTASVRGYAPTGIITWQTTDRAGIFSSNPCTLSGGSCGVSYSAATSASIMATYGGDSNNTASSATFAITANVYETVQFTVANSGPATSVTLSGCSVTPTTLTANGVPQAIQASSGCNSIVATLPAPGATSRYLSVNGVNSVVIGGCTTNPCPTFSATIYFQVQNTYQAAPKSPTSWNTPGTISVNGSSLGTPSQSVCTMSVSTGAGQFTCVGWTDYNTQAVMGPLRISQNQRWAPAQAGFTDTTGGNQHNSSYYSQVLESFQYSLVGATTAPAAPRLNYTSFGSSASSPLVGSATAVWLDSGTSWSVPSAVSGSTSMERWESVVSSGAATAGATASLSYYHQYFVTFAFSVVGGGNGFISPTASFSSFGSYSKAASGWVDAASAYNYSNPLGGSGAIERWFTPSASGSISSATTVSPTYYHQYAFGMNFTVAGGGAFNNPRLNYSAFGASSLTQINATTTTFWVDSGTGWSASTLLPSSTSQERWITKQATSGTAAAPLELQILYYHQFLGGLNYTVKGAGGSPPVPRLNYTSLNSAVQVQMGTSGTYWMDSGSNWSVTLVMPGGQGERWLANETGAPVAGTPFNLDVQYAHQFFVAVGVSTLAGGAVGNTNAWHDQLSNVVLNETTAKQWRFAYWRGTTPFSYNGTSLSPTLQVTGPSNETAIYFPGLSISTTGQGAVAYSYGSIQGTVPAETNSTIFPPPGRNVTLTAVPNTVEINFVGWTGQVAVSELHSFTKLQTGVSIAFPGSIHATFAVDYTDIRTFAVAAIGVFIAAAYILVIRRGFAPKIQSPLQVT